MSSPHLSEGSKMNYNKLRNSLFFHEGAVLPLFVTTIINRKSMGKWMSFFLFILCSGKSGVLGFLVIFWKCWSNFEWFSLFYIWNWAILSLKSLFLSFLLWFSFLKWHQSRVLSRHSVRHSVNTARAADFFQCLLVSGIWYS